MYIYITHTHPHPTHTYIMYTCIGYSGIIASNCSPKKVAEAAAQDAERYVLCVYLSVYVYMCVCKHEPPDMTNLSHIPKYIPTAPNSLTHIHIYSHTPTRSHQTTTGYAAPRWGPRRQYGSLGRMRTFSPMSPPTSITW